MVQCRPCLCVISTAASQIDSGSRVRGGFARWLSCNKSSGTAVPDDCTTLLRDELAGAFQRLGRDGQEAHFFLRDDDSDVVEDSLRSLLDICRRHRAAINLAAIPGSLTNDGARFLREQVSSGAARAPWLLVKFDILAPVMKFLASAWEQVYGLLV